MPLQTIEVLDSFGSPLTCSAKNCAGPGPNTLRQWLGDLDAIFLLSDRGRDPMVLVSFDAWQRLAQVIPHAIPDRD
jgi:hypothetical protein